MNSSVIRNILVLLLTVTIIYFWFSDKPNQIETPGLAYNLSYIEKTLNSDQQYRELPMLIILHGAGDTSENFLSWYDDFKNPVRMIAFQGAFDFGRGYTWSGAKRTEDLVQVAKSIHASIKELTDKYPTKGKPMVFGFSRGAVLAYYLSVSSDQYSYVIPVAGYLDPQLIPEESDPYIEYPEIIAFHGTKDQLIPISKDRQSVRQLQDLNYKVALNEYSSRHLPDEIMQRAIKKQISILLEKL